MQNIEYKQKSEQIVVFLLFLNVLVFRLTTEIL